MKTLPSGNNGTEWGSKILKDLSFIKKHLRYPFNKLTVVPLLIIVPLILLGVSALLDSAHEPHQAQPLRKTIILPFILLMPIVWLIRHWQVLRFKAIPTPFFATENMELVHRFLASQHIAFYRHPDAPEVFQIASRPLGNFKNEQREVMVFIADNKRILVNSHFTEQMFGFSPGSKNARKMAAQLQAWLKAQVSNDKSIVSI